MSIVRDRIGLVGFDFDVLSLAEFVKTGHRLRQQMVDERTGKVVEKEDKGRG
jgi:hypothetical protein